MIRLVMTVAALAVALLASIGTASADDGGAIGACFSANGKVKLAASSAQCDNGATFLLWNVQGAAGAQGAQGEPGPAGPQGPSGVAGHIIVRNLIVFGPDMPNPPLDHTYGVTAICPAGMRVIGGGGLMTEGHGTNIVMSDSYPDGFVGTTQQAVAWRAAWRTVDGSPFPIDEVGLAAAFAVCVVVQ